MRAEVIPARPRAIPARPEATPLRTRATALRIGVIRARTETTPARTGAASVRSQATPDRTSIVQMQGGHCPPYNCGTRRRARFGCLTTLNVNARPDSVMPFISAVGWAAVGWAPPTGLWWAVPTLHGFSRVSSDPFSRASLSLPPTPSRLFDFQQRIRFCACYYGQPPPATSAKGSGCVMTSQ